MLPFSYKFLTDITLYFAEASPYKNRELVFTGILPVQWKRQISQPKVATLQRV
jgi:hypothetical protein